MTNPYGNEPGRHPEGLGVPGAQGPGFAPPSGPYGAPPPGPSYGPPSTPQPPPGPYGGTPFGGPPPGPPQSYGQNAYGQNPSGQNPYGQPGQNPYGQPQPVNPYQAPTGFVPPAKKSSRSGLLIAIGAVVVVLALSVVGWVVLRPGTGTTTAVQPTPSRPTRTAATTATTAKSGSTTKAATTSTKSATGVPPATGAGSATSPVTECVAGDRITTATFVATVPANWFCDGDDGDISLSSATYSGLWVDHEDGTYGPEDCADQLYGYGTVEALPDESWGGVTASAYRSAEGTDIYGVRCAVVAGQTWYLFYYPHDAKGEAGVRADVTTILKTWVWK